MKRKILLCAFSVSLLFFGCSSKSISGNDWLLEQSISYSDLEQASLSISDLFSLYFVGAVDKKDILNELELLTAQISFSQEQYLEGIEAISPSSHSYASKSGEEALTTSYEITLDFLDNAELLLKAGEQQQLMYEYLEWRELLITQIATYCTAIDLVSEKKENP